MTDIIKRIISKVVDKNKKFVPVLDENGFAEKPRKFLPITEVEWLLEMRRKGIFGNGMCSESEF